MHCYEFPVCLTDEIPAINHNEICLNKSYRALLVSACFFLCVISPPLSHCATSSLAQQGTISRVHRSMYKPTGTSYQVFFTFFLVHFMLGLSCASIAKDSSLVSIDLLIQGAIAALYGSSFILNYD